MQLLENPKAPLPDDEELRLTTLELLKAKHFPAQDPQGAALCALVRVCCPVPAEGGLLPGRP